ncbi:MAG: ACP S-malonyltransferase, partial [Limisphaerales bacterium]
MAKTAILFAGQGAQVVGMGQDLVEAFPVARDLFARADEALGYDLTQVCFEGPEEALTQTENAQPGIFLVSWAALEVLKTQAPSFKFEAAAGLSLGEFTA